MVNMVEKPKGPHEVLESCKMKSFTMKRVVVLYTDQDGTTKMECSSMHAGDMCIMREVFSEVIKKTLGL